MGSLCLSAPSWKETTHYTPGIARVYAGPQPGGVLKAHWQIQKNSRAMREPKFPYRGHRH